MMRYLVKPSQKIKLEEWNPDDTCVFDGLKENAKEKLLSLNKELEGLQELFFAEHKNKLLIILQGMDTSGKDGTIRCVFEEVNPQGVKVACFKVPTPDELDHDYLWRVHAEVPAKGEIVIFNRSHYEDLLIVRVHQLVPKHVWSRRYEQIINFEQMLVEEGTTIIKFFLHISKDEQKKRLQARLADPKKMWKFNVTDLEERQRWDEYMEAYEDVLSKTSTDLSPWFIVPSNHNWLRNLLIAQIIVKTLKGLKISYPDSVENSDKTNIL